MNSGSGGVRDAHSPLVSYVRFPGEAEAERCGEMPLHVAAPSGGGGGGGRWLVVLEAMPMGSASLLPALPGGRLGGAR